MHGGLKRHQIASLRHLLKSSDCDRPALAGVCHTPGSATAWAVGALFLILIGGALGALQMLSHMMRLAHTSKPRVAIISSLMPQGCRPMLHGVMDRSK